MRRWVSLWLERQALVAEVRLLQLRITVALLEREVAERLRR